MSFIDLVRDAGIVGAGGAGFPTCFKLAPAGGDFGDAYLVANGAECEPLLQSDQRLMETKAPDIVRALLASARALGAANVVIATKSHYHASVAALRRAAEGTAIKLHLLKSTYPSGDERTLIHEVSGRIIPAGGLPHDVGCVVCNTATLVNIGAALDGKPVTDKVLTVSGAVKNPVTVEVPIGTPLSSLIEAAGGFESGGEDDYHIILGGPLMGVSAKNLDEGVTKTTGGIIPFPKTHKLVYYKTIDISRQAKMAKAVCCQCSLCTQLCPRSALGLNVSPHKAMRALSAERGKLLDNMNSIFSCCECGLCSYFACNFGLAPHVIMGNFKRELAAQGIKPQKESLRPVDAGIDNKKVPVARLVARLDLGRYNRNAPLVPFSVKVPRVKIPLKMHIGVPCRPVVTAGTAVKKGALIAQSDGLGAPIHASIDGVISAVSNDHIEIQAEHTL
ncbi:MAG: SLBB domain-containing protein [Treponema sp.]|jgi:Na+-translocating ferredoxin:NAD+ oxidoreductase RnfC subunit|nr:SLBB domain-containing protein [Treponema sp.]